MKRTPPDMAKLLRWYPEAWRARYGDELATLVEAATSGA